MHLLLATTTRRDVAGAVKGVVVVGLDMTAKILQDKAVLEVAHTHAISDAKDIFLASMSHEIRTPLSSLLGMLAASVGELKAAPAGESVSRVKKSLEVSQRAGLHLLNLVNDILDFSKMAAGKLQLEPTLCDLHAMCNNVMQMTHGLKNAYNIELRLEGLADVPRYVYVDVQRLVQARRASCASRPPPRSSGRVGHRFRPRQVLFNLLSNALKFTLCGSVTLRLTAIEAEAAAAAEVATAAAIAQERERARAERSDSSVLGRVDEGDEEGVERKAQAPGPQRCMRFAVIDTGVGIAEGDKSRLFQAFNSKSYAKAPNVTGAGLGLSICKEIVELMGSQLLLNSSSRVGSTFSFQIQLPLAAAPPSDDSTHSAAASFTTNPMSLQRYGLEPREQPDEQAGEGQVLAAAEAGDAPPRKAAEPGPSNSVLVVEDDEFNRMVLDYFLHDHPRWTCNDGLAALSVLCAPPPTPERAPPPTPERARLHSAAQRARQRPHRASPSRPGTRRSRGPRARRRTSSRSTCSSPTSTCRTSRASSSRTCCARCRTCTRSRAGCR